MSNIFIYTDGSANPNPGRTGYGIHIAIGKNDKKPTNIKGKYHLTNKGYMLKTDIKKNKDLESYKVDKIIEVYGYNRSSSTNNQAELDAVLVALRMVLDFSLNNIEPHNITMFIDSEYVLNLVTKLNNNTEAELNTYTSNKDKIETIRELLIYIDKEGLKIDFEKIRAHQIDNIGNNRADTLANMGRILNKNNEIIYGDNKKIEFSRTYVDDEKFWKDPDFDTSIYYSKLLFKFSKEMLLERTYYTINYKDLSEVGKKIPYIVYSIIKLKEPNEIINGILNIIKTTLSSMFIPYIVRLSDVLNKDTLNDLIRYGTDFIDIRNNKPIQLVTANGVEIAKEIYPPLLSATVEDNFKRLEGVINDFLKLRYNNNSVDNEKNSSNTYILNITDKIYTKNKRDKLEIKKEINDKNKLKIKFKGLNFIIYPKHDLPPRNNLSKFANKEPNMYLLIYDKERYFEYYSIIELKDGLILHVPYYTNKLIKKLLKRK